jgi:hypothetical protein
MSAGKVVMDTTHLALVGLGMSVAVGLAGRGLSGDAIIELSRSDSAMAIVLTRALAPGSETAEAFDALLSLLEEIAAPPKGASA